MKLARVTSTHIQAVTGTTFVSTLSSLMFGYCTAVISGVVGALEHNFVAPLGLQQTAAHLLLGFSVCAALFGTIIGALCARRTAELLGRRRPMILAAVLFVVSAVGSAWPEIGFALPGALGPEAIWPFIVYRAVGGLAVGVASVIAPMFVAEFAPSAVRGQLGAYQQLAIAGGVAMALFANWGIALQGDDAWVLSSGWRLMMLSMLVPALAFFWLSFTVPESPAWLVRQGRVDEAHRLLARSADAEEARALIAELTSGKAREEKPAPLLAFGARVIVIGMAFSALQQFAGLNAISYYGPQILERMGYHTDEALLGVLIARCLNLLATLSVLLVVDRIGRKPLLVIGGLVMGMAMIAIGGAFASGASGTSGLVAICGYMVGLGMSFGPIVWILMSEIFPAPIRAQAMSLTIAAQWAANCLVSASFPLLFFDPGLNALTQGGFVFFVYGGFALLAVFVVMRHVPETKGLPPAMLSDFWRRQAKPSPPPATA